MSDTTKYPEIHVKLVGTDSNAFNILGKVRKALKNGGVNMVEIEKFTEEAMGADYEYLLNVVMNWVEVD